MKTIYSTLFFLLTVIVAQAQIETLLTANTRYLFNQDEAAWEPQDSAYNYYVLLNGAGTLSEQFSFIYDDTLDLWEEQGRWTYSYDTDGDKTEDLFELLDNDEYKNDRRFTYTYNTEKLVSDYSFQKWSVDLWENDFDWTFEYNAEGLEILAEQVVWDMDMPLNEQQRLTTYDNMDLPTVRTFSKWENDQWENDRRLTYVHNSEGAILEIVTEKWAADMWNLQKKDDYSYDAEGNATEVLVSGYIGGEWVAVNRRLNEYDYDLDPEGLIVSRLNQAFDPATETWVNQVLILFYYEDIDFTVSSNSEAVLTKMRLFPNPSTGSTCSLEIPGLTTNEVLQIMDVTGQVVSLRPVGPGLNEIDLSDLPNGYYLLRLESEEGSWGEKLILQR